MKFPHSVILFLIITLTACKKEQKQSSLTPYQGNETYSVIFTGTKVGELKSHISKDSIFIDYDYKNNGRGPTIKETIVLNDEGFPINWNIKGNSTFGNPVDEHYNLNNLKAMWTDATGTDSTMVDSPMWYINQSGSPYSTILTARSLLKAPNYSLEILPAGTLKLTEMESLNVSNDSTNVQVTSYALSGADTNPSYFILDDEQRLFAFINPRFIIVREGFESEEKKLRALSEKYSKDRFEKLQETYAHNYNKNVRITNVHIFNPTTLSLSNLSSVVVQNDRIISIDSPTETKDNEVIIDGNNGSLIAGMYDMHAHTGVEEALVNILAGVTSFRDMGNDNDVLTELMTKIDSGTIAGPSIHRLGFIEGKSPYSANIGIIVSNKTEALAAVDKYHDMGYYGIKLYNSMNGDWAPAIVKHAHNYGMFVCGHVPAFSNADDMLKAGFNEMTHINQTMLGWVLEPEEDTRTLLRLTALKRLPSVDLNSDKVQETMALFIKNKTAMDPTLAIHEALLLARNGKIWPGTKDIIDHMPPSVQRSLKVAMADISNPEDDIAYREAFTKIIETLKMMKDKGIFIVPGTDLGGSFFYHRELELYEQLGYSPAELLKLASYDMAKYLDDENLGSIEEGNLADFFLVPGDPTKDIKAIKTISLVSKGGTFYYPTEIYPEFGIKPFTEKPEINE